MAPIDNKQQAERRLLALLEDAGLPRPDAIEYGEDEVRFLWEDLRVALVIELDEFAQSAHDGHFDLGSYAA
jgi:hypothetical protein